MSAAWVLYVISKDEKFEHLLNQIEDGNAVADWGQETSAIWSKEEISFAVNCS